MSRPHFEPRLCAEKGCPRTYIPTGPASKYCEAHQDYKLRKRGRWSLLRARSRRRGIIHDACECCGAAAGGGSYFGVVCCSRCREDAEQVASEWLRDRSARHAVEAKAS